MWREHGILRSTDLVSQQDPSLLRDAQFMHNLTTGARTDGEIYVEVAYRFYAHDHDIDAGNGVAMSKLAADEGTMMCVCLPEDAGGTECSGMLAFGNYEFSLTVGYNREQCSSEVNPQRKEEFRRSLQTADKLINLYLEPLRRKPRWL